MKNTSKGKDTILKGLYAWQMVECAEKKLQIYATSQAQS